MSAVTTCLLVFLVMGLLGFGSCVVLVAVGAHNAKTSADAAAPTALPSAPVASVPPPEPIDPIRGAKPRYSPWDGSCTPCEEYVKPRMNDPDSYEHVRSTMPMAQGKNWVVDMAYRGKNGFGAKVLQANRFLIHDGKVVQVTAVD